MTQTRRTVLTQVAFLTGCIAMCCTPVHAGNRTFTFNEIHDFWRLVKETEYPTVDALEKAVVSRFGQFPIRFYGMDFKTNEVRGVEMIKIMPYSNLNPTLAADKGAYGPIDGAVIKYKIFAGADHIPLSKRDGYFPVGLFPPH